MTTEITFSSQLIGLAAAGAAALGMSLSEGLLQPMGKLAAIRTLPRRPERREPSRRADQPTPEQQAELARQLAAAGTPAELADAAAAPIRLPGYDPSFTPDPENFGNI